MREISQCTARSSQLLEHQDVDGELQWALRVAYSIPPWYPWAGGCWAFSRSRSFFNCKNRKYLNDIGNNNKLRDKKAVGADGDHLLPTKSLLWQFEFMCGVKHSAIWKTTLHHRFSSHRKFHPAELERHQKDGLWCTKNLEFGGCPLVSWYHHPSLCSELWIKRSWQFLFI